MIDSRKQYVLSLGNLSNASIELVGQFAKDLEKIQQLGVNYPNGFVITTQVFDDFLIANELLDFISPRINDVDYDNKNSVKKASEEIMQAINAAKFPNILSEPILQGYSGLSGFYDAFVSISKSPINLDLNEASYTDLSGPSNVAGKEMLLDKIKEIWSTLFTPEAILYRGSIGYEGYLTQSIVVQKMLQSEVSGKMFSIDQANLDNSMIEIQAFFGLNDQSLYKDMTPDSYFVKKVGEEIVEKKIVGQDWMLVRKGKSGDKNPVIKIPISKLWQKKQKLDDKYIVALARNSKLLEDAFGGNIEATWDYEGGKLYVTSMILHQYAPVEEKVEEVPVVSTEVAGPSKSMDEYLDEIKQIREDLSTNNSLVADGKVVVDIRMFEELQMLSQGTGVGEVSAFGLVHHIFSDTDYQDLTGDEILIVKKLDLIHIDIINSSKGLIIENPVHEEDLLSINVPIIFGVADAFEIFQENEVVTLRPWNGSIYLGAGKDSQDPKQQASQQRIAEVIPEKEPEAEVEVEAEEEDMGAESETFKPEFIPIKKEVEIVGNLDLPNTATDFWLAYHAGIIIDGLESLDGLVIRVTDMVDQYDKELFTNELNSKLVEILNKVKGKPVILISAGRGKLMEEIVEAELAAISNLRNKDSMRNLWYSFDNISKPEDLIRLKKVFSNQGLRRSSTFKLFLTIHSPHSFIALKGLLANDVDGIIMDIDLMFMDHAIKTSLEDEHIQEYICEKIDLINQNQTLSFVLANETEIPSSVAKHFIKAGLHSLALIQNEIIKLKPFIAEAESVTKIEKRKKRGRKRKEIDFGF